MEKISKKMEFLICRMCMCFEAINQQLAWTLPQGPTRHEWAEVAELYKEEDLGAPQSHS